MSDNFKCPCGSGKEFFQCCRPIILNHSLAVTPEELMRSRYTAYVIKESSYILNTWDYNYRPESVSFDKNITWLNLKILQAQHPKNDETTGKVTFIASFIQNNHLVEMTETSVFILKDGKWYYQDGDPSTYQKKIALNSSCPCGSSKKFKRCCYKK